MKRKIVIGLSVYATAYLLAGAYIANTIRAATDGLDQLVTLHQVELLRGDYLLKLKAVQSDLILTATPHRRSVEATGTNIAKLGKLIDGCFECHHSPAATERLRTLRRQTDAYRDALSRVPLVHANVGSRALAQEELAFVMGEELIAQVRELVDVTAARLAGRTRRSMAEITHARHVLYVLVGLGPVLSSLLGFVCISGLVRPVGVLLQSARRLEKGDLDHRVGELPNEFRELGVAFNEMAHSLKEQMQRMQRTEQMVVVGQLAAGLAHEVKNPLAGIKAAMQVLCEEGGLSEEDHRLAQKVSGEVVRVDGLMKSFLNFARPAKPQLTALNVNGLVESVLALHASGPPSPSHGAVRMVKDLRPVPDTLADPMQLQQVVLNLVLNAVEAMPDGGTVVVRTSVAGGGASVCVDVADTGRGIDPKHLDKIFEPFFTTKAEGTGLGLAISKRLVEQHGGAILVEANPGGGTVFRIQLPVVTTAAEATS